MIKRLLLSVAVLLPISAMAKQTIVHIKADNGNYLSLNPTLDYFVKAYKPEVRDWEVFTLEHLDNETVTIKGYNGMYLSINAEYNSLQGTENNDNPQTFRLIEKEAGKYLLGTKDGRYFAVESDQFVYISRGNEDDAGIFTLEPTLPYKLKSSLSVRQNAVLFTGIALLLLSLLAFMNKKRYAVWLLLLGALTLRLFMAAVAEYLHLWDEQFHALVAKNMMQQPFRPMLYANPVLPYPELSWIEGHIWLHKQPLFLWQMALSMKAFGVGVMALRLPSVLMSTAVVVMIYFLGKRLVDKQTGFFAAFFFAFGNYGLQLMNGYLSTDHNDVAFMFYVTASLLSWVIYISKGKPLSWALLTGALAGGAIMVKWLPGMLVYAGWGVALILDNNRRSIGHYAHLVAALLVTCIVVLPWQIYTFTAFPELAKHEMFYNTAHIRSAVEQHQGNWLYHFSMSQKHIGIPFLLLLLGWYLFVKKINDRRLKIAVVTWGVVVYLVFTLSQTKMPSFTYMIIALHMLAFAQLAIHLFNIVIINPKLPKATLIQTLFIVGISGYIGWKSLNYKAIQTRHTIWRKNADDMYKHRMLTVDLFRELAQTTTDKDVFFHSKTFDNVPLMFFTDAAAAYDRMLSEEDIIHLLQKGYQPKVFDDGELPEYIYKHNVDIIQRYWFPL
ncbi:MAG: glycosyltransferase family 39 protein [Cryomorphaceae bacterium]|nr:glycosyltransferase family 39 protein [Cryomorphaceae bacterium]